MGVGGDWELGGGGAKLQLLSTSEHKAVEFEAILNINNNNNNNKNPQ